MAESQGIIHNLNTTHEWIHNWNANAETLLNVVSQNIERLMIKDIINID